MSDVSTLYQAVILRHGKNPSHFSLPEDATHRAEGDNPLCGDRLTVAATLDTTDSGHRFRDLGFRGMGCAISLAAASLMSEACLGQDVAVATELGRQFHALVSGQRDPDAFIAGAPAGTSAHAIAQLAAFSGVARYPMRIKCATLSWQTLAAALAGDPERVTTE